MPQGGDEAVRQDFKDARVRSLNEVAEQLSPGLRVAI
mgnify:CR=1 FL=1